MAWYLIVIAVFCALPYLYTKTRPLFVQWNNGYKDVRTLFEQCHTDNYIVNFILDKASQSDRWYTEGMVSALKDNSAIAYAQLKERVKSKSA